MNPKFFVVGIVAAFAIIIGIVGFSGQSLFNDISDEGFLTTESSQLEILPLEVELKEISILEVSDKAASIEVQFIVTNPNSKSVLLPFLKYQIYEKDLRIHIGEIGERLDSMVVGSNYVTLLTDQPTVLRDEFDLKNTGNLPELWDALSSDNPDWSIKGELVYSLSSMTAGGQNEMTFEFPKPQV